MGTLESPCTPQRWTGMELSNETRDLVSDHFLKSRAGGGRGDNLFGLQKNYIMKLHSRHLWNSVPEVKCHT